MGSMGVKWDVLSQQWENMFALLLQYKRRNDRCDVPISHKEDGEPLGKWLSKQRQAKKKGKLDPEKEQRLESNGVVWDVLSQQWENMFVLLLQYKQRNDHCDVPYNHKEDGKPLGVWLMTQRQNKKKGKLDSKRLQRLEDLGVVWTIR